MSGPFAQVAGSPGSREWAEIKRWDPRTHMTQAQQQKVGVPETQMISDILIFFEAGETHSVRTCGAVSMIFATSVLVFIKPCSRNLFLCSIHLHTWCIGARFSRGPYGGVIKFDPTMRQRAFGKPRNEFQLSSVKEQTLICHCSLFF